MREALYVLGVLTDSDIDWLVAAGKRREIAAGSVLIEAGQPVTSIYLVIEGAFMAHRAVQEAGEGTRLMPGDVIGESSLAGQMSPARTVHALEQSFVLDIPRHRLASKIADDAGFAERFYRGLAGKAQQTSDSGEGSDCEMAFDALDNLSMAGARFDWIQKRLRSA